MTAHGDLQNVLDSKIRNFQNFDLSEGDLYERRRSFEAATEYIKTKAAETEKDETIRKQKTEPWYSLVNQFAHGDGRTRLVRSARAVAQQRCTSTRSVRVQTGSA